MMTRRIINEMPILRERKKSRAHVGTGTTSSKTMPNNPSVKIRSDCLNRRLHGDWDWLSVGALEAIFYGVRISSGGF